MPKGRKPAPPPLQEGEGRTTALDRAVEAVVARVQKRYGKGALTRLRAPGAYPEIKHVVPTGLPALDVAFGCGGVPLGKLVELIGPESSLKTTLCKHLAGQAQRHGVVPVVLDTEQSGALDYDRGLGVQVDWALGGQPDTLEEVFQIMQTVMEGFAASRTRALIIFDSVAATPLKAEMEIGFDEEGRFAGRAGYLSRNLPKLLKGMKGGMVGLVFVNQLRDKIGATRYQKQTYSPGGHALHHWAHVRCELTPFGAVRRGDTVVGLRARAKMIKNKLGAPLREALLELQFAPPHLSDVTGKRTPLE